MSVSPFTSLTVKLDQPTVLAGGLVLALMSGVFIVLGALPDDLNFLGKVAEIFGPLLCVPIFGKLRDGISHRRLTALGSLEPSQPNTGYQWLSFALIATLVLTFLAELFNTVSIVQKSFLLEQMQEGGVALDEATIAQWSSHGDGVVVLPLTFMAAAAIGWFIHYTRVRRPWICIAAIFGLMLVVRVLYVVFKPSLRENLLAMSDQFDPVLLFSLAILSWPLAVLLGAIFGYLGRILSLAVVGFVRSLIRGGDPSPPSSATPVNPAPGGSPIAAGQQPVA